MTQAFSFSLDLLALPPVDAVFNMTVANITSTVYGVAILILLLRAWFRPGEWHITLAMVIGGILCTIVEPLVDVATGVWHPEVGQDTVFSLAGHSIPLWVVIAYALYYGGNGSLMLVAFNKGVTRRGVWLWVTVPLIFDPFIEIAMLHYDLYYYIGNQPLVVAKFPLVQMPCNAVAVLLGVAVLHFLQPVLQGWRLYLAAAMLMPICAGAGWGAVMIPDFACVNSTWPNWAVQSCGVLVYLLAAVIVHGVAQVVATNSPYQVRIGTTGHPSRSKASLQAVRGIA